MSSFRRWRVLFGSTARRYELMKSDEIREEIWPRSHFLLEIRAHRSLWPVPWHLLDRLVPRHGVPTDPTEEGGVACFNGLKE